MSKELLQQALDVLHPYKSTVTRGYTEVDRTIDALRAALAQPEQTDDLTIAYMSGLYDGEALRQAVPVIAQPVPNKSLTRSNRDLVGDLMALVDTYADTACVNGIRSGWAVMARTSVQQALVNGNQCVAPIVQPAMTGGDK